MREIRLPDTRTGDPKLGKALKLACLLDGNDLEGMQFSVFAAN